MKFFENKQILKKVIISFLTVFLLQYIIPFNFTMADKDTEQELIESGDKDSDWGGLLFLPIQNFLLALGDAGIVALNLFIGGEGNSIISLLKKDGFLDNIFDLTSFFSGGEGFIGYITSYVGSFIQGKVTRPFIKHIVSEFRDDDFFNAITLPIVAISPERIFSNQIPLLDVNIINPKKYTYEDKDGKEQEVNSTATILQSTISSWYNVLKDIATVLFLSVLVYIGIRILISSVASDKAKYKKMLIDWIVGFCLLFTMHYIMSFAFTMTEKFVELLSSTNEVITIQSADDKVNLSDYKIQGKNEILEKFNVDDEGNYVEKLSWRTNFVGYVRFYAQSNIKSFPLALRFAYTLMYLILVIYTYMFLFQYVKRFMYIVFLTLFAPVIAVLYPIQKASGKAPSTTKYVKDWGINLSLILVHSILYKILMGTSMDLVTTNPLYGVLALASIMEAGKIFKQYIDAQGGSAAVDDATSGLVTGALVMQGVKNVAGMAKGLASGNGKTGSGTGSKSNVRMADNRTSSHSPSKEEEFMNRTLGGGSYNTNLEHQTTTSAGAGSMNTGNSGASAGNMNTGNSGTGARNMNTGNGGASAGNMNTDNSGASAGNMNTGNGGASAGNMNTDNSGTSAGNMDIDDSGIGAGNMNIGNSGTSVENMNAGNNDDNVNTDNNDSGVNNIDTGHINFANNNQEQGMDEMQGNSENNSGNRIDYLQRLAQEVEAGNPIVSPLPNESNRYDNPALEKWAKDVENDENANFLYRRDSENYDNYGNYMPHDGQNVNDDPNLGKWAKDIDIDKNSNLLHQRDQEHYDKYGNYVKRDGKAQSNRKNKKIKSFPAQAQNRVEATKDKAKSMVSKVANSEVAKETTGRVRYYAPKLAKAAVKGTFKAAGAVTLGTVGLAAGAATKDSKDMITYGLGAMAVGAGVGSAFANQTYSMRDKVQQRRNEIKKEVYRNDPDGYEEYLNRQADRDFMRDKEKKRQYAEAFGSSNAREMMNHALKYREHGITDDRLIIKAMKETSGEIGKTDSYTDDRRIAAAKLASGISNSKDIENMTKRLQKKGYEKNVIDQNEEFVRSIKGFKYN